ncbi:MAG TPA: nitroreductase family deazaflavin-dependent oxidoreductase [Ktedonobacteraceae bacterium]|nr:nitroreductase family deazaflavin-dependent oxidoreductase [Ktedonobacteraceae bacterium]
MSDWNNQVISEFRTNEGKVGGPFKGAPLLLLTTTGAKSGQPRTSPLMYLPDGERMLIFASKGGAPTNPDWYHNLMAHPQATVEVGTETFNVTATPVTGEERDRLYAIQAKRYSGFADYQAKTTRKIPVIALERI